jgi:hypothetical protein
MCGATTGGIPGSVARYALVGVGTGLAGTAVVVTSALASTVGAGLIAVVVVIMRVVAGVGGALVLLGGVELGIRVVVGRRVIG